MVKVRLKFSKYGPIRFVGHLDVMRYFQKVMRRAGVDIAYSEGYSPHQLMSFAQPLSVGATSDGEYADIVLNGNAETEKDDVFCRDLVSRLNAVCNEGITFLDAFLLADKADKAMTAVAACAWQAAYRPDVSGNMSPAGQGRGTFQTFLSQPCITAHKKSKKGLTEIDIKPMIYRAEISDGGVFDLLLKSGSEDNVKPALFLGAYLRFSKADQERFYLQGDELKPECLKLHRAETYRLSSYSDGMFLEPLICRDRAKQIRTGQIADRA